MVEWYDRRYFYKPIKNINLDFFNELFVTKQSEIAGIDGIIQKIQLQAVREGKLFLIP